MIRAEVCTGTALPAVLIKRRPWRGTDPNRVGRVFTERDILDY